MHHCKKLNNKSSLDKHFTCVENFQYSQIIETCLVVKFKPDLDENNVLGSTINFKQNSCREIVLPLTQNVNANFLKHLAAFSFINSGLAP